MIPARWVLPSLLLLPGCPSGDDQGDAGSDEASAMEESMAPADTTAGGACFPAPQCDPLAPDCPTGAKCIPNDGVFSCVDMIDGIPEAGVGEACDSSLGCQPGLLCLPVAVPGCIGEGCCVALCDLQQPQCPTGLACEAAFEDPLPSCYDHVGVCVPP